MQMHWIAIFSHKNWFILKTRVYLGFRSRFNNSVSTVHNLIIYLENSSYFFVGNTLMDSAHFVHIFKDMYIYTTVQ